jgi:hypothetical protein
MEYVLSEFIIDFDKSVNCLEQNDSIILNDRALLNPINPRLLRYFKEKLIERAEYVDCELICFTCVGCHETLHFKPLNSIIIKCISQKALKQ